MKTDTEKGLHLTVNHDGVISLWDDETTAKEIKEEEYVLFPLTDTGRVILDTAQRNARLRRLTASASSIGKEITLDGYEELASIGAVSDGTANAKVVHNNSDHILVATQQVGGPPNTWRLAASYPYTTTAFEVAYSEALRFACLAVGAIAIREK